MIQKECKRQAEVDFPAAVVSKHAAQEKSNRYGHLSTLHLWWARRRLGVCRAMLLGLFLPDPCDEHCPVGFKQTARKLLPKVEGKSAPKTRTFENLCSSSSATSPIGISCPTALTWKSRAGL
jgi:putative DNA methylase